MNIVIALGYQLMIYSCLLYSTDNVKSFSYIYTHIWITSSKTFCWNSLQIE